MKCVVIEKASITKCSQGFIVSNPKPAAYVSMVISFLSSLILIGVLSFNFSVTERCCCRNCIGLMKCLKKLSKKGSFWSMNILLFVTFVYYCYVIHRMDGDKQVSILILLWFLATPFVAYRLNYLYPVPCPENLRDTCCANWRKVESFFGAIWSKVESFFGAIWGRVKRCFGCRDHRDQRPEQNSHPLCRNNCVQYCKCCVLCSEYCVPCPTSDMWWFLFYWSTLVIYFIESSYMFLAVTLDAANEVTPLINGKFSDEVVEFKGLVVALLGIRVAFNGRLLLFFWNKIFHGHKDLFSEPNRLLTQPVVRVMQCPQQPDDERRQPGPRQGPEE